MNECSNGVMFGFGGDEPVGEPLVSPRDVRHHRRLLVRDRAEPPTRTPTARRPTRARCRSHTCSKPVAASFTYSPQIEPSSRPSRCRRRTATARRARPSRTAARGSERRTESGRTGAAHDDVGIDDHRGLGRGHDQLAIASLGLPFADVDARLRPPAPRARSTPSRRLTSGREPLREAAAARSGPRGVRLRSGTAVGICDTPVRIRRELSGRAIPGR